MQAGQNYASFQQQQGGQTPGGQQHNYEQNNINNYNSPQHIMSGGAGQMGQQTPDNKGSMRGGSPVSSMKFGTAGGLPYEMHRLGGRNEDGLAHMVVMKTFRGWHCPSCSYISPSQKGNLKVHILNRHANPGESYACMFCGKHLSSRSSLQVHISQVHREQQKTKRMLEERLKITSLEERLKTEMNAAGGQLCLDMGSTAEALRQAMQHEDRMRAQHELGGMLGGQHQGLSRMLAISHETGGFESGPTSSAGSVPHSPRQPHQEGSPGYSPGTSQGPEEPPPVEAHYHKEAGGDAVSVYPKEMADAPSLVYHKQVGGHSVSIYPKDAIVQGMSESSGTGYPGSPLAPGPYPSSPLPPASLHSMATNHSQHAD